LKRDIKNRQTLDDINTAIENAGKLEIYKLEKNVSMLATISGAGPMTGFLGTVGMIQAFHKMATAGGQIEVGAPVIYTAMTTTVVGLVVELLLMVQSSCSETNSSSNGSQ
jgi:biopolymer transport protein ExbB